MNREIYSKIENKVLVKADIRDLDNPDFWSKFKTIGSDAFYNFKFPKNYTLTIPNNIRKIDRFAFAKSTGLVSINLPNTIKELPGACFAFSRDLESVKLPRGITYIPKDLFRGCENLQNVTLPDSINEIAEFAFYDCKSLENIVLPQKLKAIGNMCFHSCESLRDIVLPQKLYNIKNHCFGKCESLENIVIPEGVKILGEAVFHGCKNLTSVKFPSSLESIGSHCFADCKKLKDIDFPESLDYIGSCSFRDCNSLTSIKIPSGVEIETHAFSGCRNLKDVYIDDNSKFTWACHDTFSHCINLESVRLPSDLTIIPEGTFDGCISLTSIELPSALERIGTEAFRNCSFNSIELPDSLERIDKNALENTEIEKLVIPEKVEECCDLFGKLGSSSLKELVFAGGKTMFNLNHSPFAKNKKVNFSMNMHGLNNNIENLCCRLAQNDGGRKINNVSKILLAKDKSEIRVVGDGIKIPNKNDYVAFNVKFNSPFIAFSKMKITKEEESVADKNLNFDDVLSSFNSSANYLDCLKLIEDKKIERVPNSTILHTFPNSQIDSLFANGNLKLFYKLFSKYGFEKIDHDLLRENARQELLKIYYALGGFSTDIKARDEAYRYVEKILGKDYNMIKDYWEKQNHETSDDFMAENLAEEIHGEFTEFVLKDKPYNPVFAEFFMKHYLDDSNFMKFYVDYDDKIYSKKELEELERKGLSIINSLEDDDDEEDFDNDIDEGDYIYIEDERNLLAQAHNNFDYLLKIYPNMVIRGNTNRDLLTPEFVAKHLSLQTYDDVYEGNESLAQIVGQYGYDQHTFNQIQEIYEKSKKIKQDYIIMANKDSENNPIQYRFLEKDDPIGFVLGNITNCCQHMGGAAESCVVDGFTSNSSGFLVFEKDVLKNGKPTGEKRIIGQAYIWYDAKTETVCYDNIEIPNSVIKVLNKNAQELKDFESALVRSADAILLTMNAEGKNKVKNVTTGTAYNDLIKILDAKFNKLNNTNFMPRNPNGGVYTDASVQYLIRTYDQATKDYEKNIRSNLSMADNMLDRLENNKEMQ